jgi:hypothetical protein
MQSRRCCLMLLHVAGVILAHRADAQGLASGQRVRVMESTSRRALVVGQLIRQTNDSVVIRPDSASTSGSERVWLLERDHRIEQSAGLRGRTRKGMGVGLLVGLAAGAAIGAGSYSKPKCSGDFICFDYGRGSAATAGAVLLGLPVMVIGGIIGHGSKHETWRPVSDQGPRVMVAPRPSGGVRFSAVMPF